MAIVAAILAIAVLALGSYSLSLRGIIRGAIVAADGYAPGGRDHVRIPYNMACRWAFYHGTNYPYKKYTQTKGVHVSDGKF